MDIRIALVSVAILFGLLGYAFYLRDMVRRRTRPHIFSWFLWGLTTGIAFFAQLAAGGGIGAWATGAGALLCFIVFFLSLSFYGKASVTRFDWACLFAALLGVAVWRITRNPLSAVIFVTLVDVVAFFPTFRKSYHRPDEETASLYTLDSARFLLGTFALEAFSLTTVLYPLAIISSNLALTALLLVRRRQLSAESRAKRQ